MIYKLIVIDKLKRLIGKSKNPENTGVSKFINSEKICL